MLYKCIDYWFQTDCKKPEKYTQWSPTLQQASYYDHLILVRTQSQSVIFAFKNPFTSARFLWPLGARINRVSLWILQSYSAAHYPRGIMDKSQSYSCTTFKLQCSIEASTERLRTWLLLIDIKVRTISYSIINSATWKYCSALLNRIYLHTH